MGIYKIDARSQQGNINLAIKSESKKTIGENRIKEAVYMTQSAYDSLQKKIKDKLYIIVEE